MNKAEPYVKLISKMDCRESAWKTSRPSVKGDDVSLDALTDMDMSLNSMLMYTLEIRSSSFFRDLVFSTRPIAPWSMSVRNLPINSDTLKISAEVVDDKYGQMCIDNMIEGVASGMTRDQTRDRLPLSLSGAYTFVIDHRALMSFCKTVENLSPFLFNIYCIPMLSVCEAFDSYVRTTVKSAEAFYIISDNEKINGTKRIGNLILGHYKVKMALASQILRQHSAKVKIGLWNIIDTYPEEKYNQSTLMDVVFYADINSHNKLMSMRCHWAINFGDDMWGGIVGDYVKDMSAQEFWEFLPNGNGKKDPFFADVYTRIINDDAGIPCPIMCEWPALVWMREEEVGEYNIVLSKYKQLVHEGFIKDNPDNEHRVKYSQIRGIN